MPSLSEFRKLLSDWDYELVEETPATNESLVGSLSGPILQPLVPFLRASAEVCNIGLVIGLFNLVPERNRYSLLLSLLELDWDHALARISIVNTPVPKAEKAEKGESVRVIVAETTFFWSGANRNYFDSRMKALNAISLAASQHLAARSSLSNSNPFYDRLKGTTSPVIRESFQPQE